MECCLEGWREGEEGRGEHPRLVGEGDKSGLSTVTQKFDLILTSMAFRTSGSNSEFYFTDFQVSFEPFRSNVNGSREEWLKPHPQFGGLGKDFGDGWASSVTLCAQTTAE